MVLDAWDSWVLRTPGMNVEEEIIIRSPIYVPSSQIAIFSVIQPMQSTSRIYFGAFSLYVRK